MGKTSRKNIANLSIPPNNDKSHPLQYSGKLKAQTKREDKMDVTALMDLLDKNRSTKSIDEKTNTPSSTLPKKEKAPKKPKKEGFSTIKSNLSEREKHTPGNGNEPVFTTNPMRHVVLLSVILATAIVFLGLVWMIDNKADDWFVGISHTEQNSARSLAPIAPSAGTSQREQRMAHDRYIATQTTSSADAEHPVIIPVDSDELLELLSKKSTDTTPKE